jgi:hypothetical protein
LHSTGTRGPEPRKEEQAHSFLVFLQQQPENVKWLWEQFQVDVEFQDLVQWLESGDVIAVSGGSYKENMGTSSWRILKKHDETKIISGANFVPGRAQDQSLYRSELAGMFGIIVFISLLVEFFEMGQGNLEIAGDEI